MKQPPTDDQVIVSPTPPVYRVRMLAPPDLVALEPVLREHVRDLLSGVVVEKEVAAILACMQGAADEDGRLRHYLVVTDADDRAVACMALATPERRMQQHFSAIAPAAGGTSVELLNAFVASAHRNGQGVGRLLLTALCARGAQEGALTLLVNSGPRYRHSWGFYDRVCDSSHGMIDDYYGPGRHAKTWLKSLRTPL